MNSPGNSSNLTVDEALREITSAVYPAGEAGFVPVADSVNRVLAAGITARKDIPAFDNSAMDGYLFHTDDIRCGQRRFSVDGEIRPENRNAARFGTGFCKQIMTGAPVPDGDFTVVPVELVEETGSGIIVLGIPERNPVRRKGEGYRMGKTVLSKDTLIRPYEMGLMVESGNRECSVKAVIRLALQVTGNEIDEGSDTNGPVLESLLRKWPGTRVSRYPVLSDDPVLVQDRMEELGKDADMVLTTGGISMGRHDYILQAMEKLGAGIIVRKVQQKPGKPFTVTRIGKTLYFHLPGNPVSCVFTAEFYVRIALEKMLGIRHHQMKAIATGGLYNPANDKTLFVTGKLGQDDQGRITVSADSAMKSHLLQLYRGSDAYIRLEPGMRCSEGDIVDVIPFTC